MQWRTSRLSPWLSGLMLLLAGLAISLSVMARTPQGAQGSQGAQAASGAVSVRDLPPEAQRVLVLIQNGGPFKHARDGINFFNRERLLPNQPRGYYTEYTVPTPGARDRGARRIVAGRGATGNPATSGEYWYTADHYSSFRRIQE